METQMIIIMAVVIILIGYFIYKKKIDEAKKHTVGNDFLIIFEKDRYQDIRKIKEFRDIGTFQQYGEYGFRGQVSLKKDELESLIKVTCHLTDEDFSVVNPAGLYKPH